MKTHIPALAMVALISLGACNNSGDSVKEANDSNEVKMDSVTSTPIPITVSETDSKFMVSAGNAGMTEIELGKMAEQNAASEQVKAFGRLMVKDHTAAANELKALAKERNVTLPDSLSDESRKHHDKLMEKKGKQFDKAYMDMMVDGHKKVIDDFEDELKNGNDQAIKDFVNKTLPVIRAHADSAAAIKKQLK